MQAANNTVVAAGFQVWGYLFICDDYYYDYYILFGEGGGLALEFGAFWSIEPEKKTSSRELDFT